jgi:hypothetical protein
MIGSARFLAMPILAASLCAAAHAEGEAHPCAEDMPQGGADGVLADLSAAQLVQRTAVAAVLAAANLAPAELGHLSPGEHAEIMEFMRAGEITLGDRFRLRLLAEAGGATFFAAPQESPKAHGRHGQARRLQGDSAKKGDGLSSDSIALMVTAFLGIGSFIVQVARVSLACRCVHLRIPIHVFLKELIQRHLFRSTGSLGETSITLGHRCTERARPKAGGARGRTQHRLGAVGASADADGRVHASLAVCSGLGVI